MQTESITYYFQNQKNLTGQLVHKGNTFSVEDLKNIRLLLATNTDKNSGLWKFQRIWNQHRHLQSNKQSGYKDQFKAFHQTILDYYSYIQSLSYPEEIEEYRTKLMAKARNNGILYEVLAGGVLLDKCELIDNQHELDAFYLLSRNSAIRWVRDKVINAINDGRLVSDLELIKMSSEFRKKYHIKAVCESC